MTTSEFSNEFDILYNNISSNAAPGVTEYEKSVFLTMAQEDFIKEVYKNYEYNEEIREYIQNQVTTARVKQNNVLFSITNTYYIIPDNLMFLVSSYKYIKNEEIPVIIIPQDQFLKIKKNPFKTTNKNRIIGIMMGNTIYTYEQPLIESSVSSFLYIVYVKKPEPIILTNLKDVTINGYTEIKECELPTSVHYDILKRAVQLALTSNGIAAGQNV